MLAGAAIVVFGTIAAIAWWVSSHTQESLPIGSEDQDAHRDLGSTPGVRGTGYRDQRTTRWDPYDVSQSRETKIRERRQRPFARPSHADYYALLGVEPECRDEHIERAYRLQVALIHPDRFHTNPSQRHLAEQRLRELNHAMQVLRDPVERAHYDATR